MRLVTRAHLIAVAAFGCAFASSHLHAQNANINYGRITAVSQVDIRNPDSQAAGALIGGLAGLATGSGQSGSNRALRGIGGAAIGGRVGAAAGSSTGFEYTVLIGGTRTIRMVTEKAGLRVGDCVSVEQGAFNNLRLAEDERCDFSQVRPPVQATASANACILAKEQLLDAETDEDFNRAERRVRLLCD